MYEEALRNLYWKFGQSEKVGSAHLEKLSNYPPVKIYSSESFITFATMMENLVGVSISLRYKANLNSTSSEPSCSKASAQPQRSEVIFHYQRVSRATVISRIQHMAQAKG